MEKNTRPLGSKSYVWASLEKLMLAHWGRPNISRLARESGVGMATVSRLQHDDGVTSTGLDKIEKLAAVFGVKPWQLLDPAFDPSNATPSFSPKAISLATAFDRITDPMAQAKAYAMCLQLLDFANPPLQQTQLPGAEPR